MLVFSIVFIVSALICYSIGVWSERIQKILKPWHLIFFWIGFLCDTTGTTLMGIMSSSFTLSIHAVTGALAIVLMAFHAVWATIVLAKKNKAQLQSFHKFSTVVWFVWLVPFFTGMIMNMKF